MSELKVAFALGGLAGNNSHGAGFLYTALKEGIKPTIISCTSGQIRWVYVYLNSKGNPDFFIDRYKKELRQNRTTGEPNVDLANLMLFGFPGVFRPAYEKWGLDIVANGVETISENFIKLQKGEHPLFFGNLLSLTTNRIAVPLFDKDDLKKISEIFKKSDIGIVFNSYDPINGVENVYLNDAARRELHKPEKPDYYLDGKRNEFREYRVYKEITPFAVRDALWLYMYGFRSNKNSHIDGAFFRDVMLAELVSSQVIFSVRPFNHQWKGKLPNSYQTNEDMKTEVSFNGCYSAERDQLNLINKLIDDKVFEKDNPKASRYHRIDLVEIEIRTQRGYFEYALESQDVFDDAIKVTIDKIKQLRKENKL